MKDISKRIKELRLEKHMTQDELAEQLHVTRQAISKWETQKARPDLEMLEAMSQIFGITVTELLYGDRKTHNKRKVREMIFFGICVLLGFVIELVFLPKAIAYSYQTYDSHWFALCRLLMCIFYGCIGPCILSAVSMSMDIKIKNTWVRKGLLAVGLLIGGCIAGYYLMLMATSIASMNKDSFSYSWPQFTAIFVRVAMKKWTHHVAGILIYLGLDRS